ncbi:hypothetical protein HanOQP8_Chr04g0142661 [Helianthus annuus]|nr:hypothetical protein HanOQP8_Chr04g0142661 [Helianthus annuus]
MFVHLTNRTKFLVHVRSFIKRTNINELPAERFTNCSLNVRFVYSPRYKNPITRTHINTWQPSVTANIELSFPLSKCCKKLTAVGYHNLQ